jgi:heterogeneous nuclear ribonucleoprotein G
MKLFIGNLDAGVKSHDLFLLFSNFGDVAAAHVSKDGEGNSRGFGYVQMKTRSDGQNAIAALNKKKFMGQFIALSEAIQSKENCNYVAIQL